MVRMKGSNICSQFGSKLPRQFTVRHSTPEEAAMFEGRRNYADQAVTIIDHAEGDLIFVVAAADALVENTDECGWTLFREQRA